MLIKKFIVKIIFYGMLFLGVYLFFVDRLSKKYVDPNYNKFTQEAGGLILGLSRANEGISPDILENELRTSNFNTPIINFAINEAHFGEIYLNGIKKKITESNKDGLFILSVSPGNFTVTGDLDNDEILEFDKNLKLGKVSNFTSYPNYNYIIKTYGKPLYNALYSFGSWSHRISHANGWNEVVLIAQGDTIKDSDIAHWKKLNMEFYQKKIKIEQFAPYRFDYFIKTIKYLMSKGKVFLVRMPSDSDFLEFEHRYWKDFDFSMDSVARINKIPYFNYSNKAGEYKTYDGSHLVSESAKEFTKLLSTDIKAYLKSIQGSK